MRNIVSWLLKRDSLLLGALLCAFAIGAVLLHLEQLKEEEQKEAASVESMRPFLEEGKVFHLANVFPFEWDEVEIANGPVGTEDFFADLYAFDPSFQAYDGTYFLVMFYRDGKVADYLQYARVSGKITPVFVENHRLAYGWHKRIPREKAIFYCDGIQGEDRDFLCTLVPEV